MHFVKKKPEDKIKHSMQIPLILAMENTIENMDLT